MPARTRTPLPTEPPRTPQTNSSQSVLMWAVFWDECRLQATVWRKRRLPTSRVRIGVQGRSRITNQRKFPCKSSAEFFNACVSMYVDCYELMILSAAVDRKVKGRFYKISAAVDLALWNSQNSSTQDMASLDVVVPGDLLGTAEQFECGPGTYLNNGHITSSLLGVRSIVPASSTDGAAAGKSIVLVSRGHGIQESAGAVPEVGSIVVARVLRITNLQAHCEILICDGRTLQSPFTAVLRKEHVRETEIDKVRVDEICRPPDLIQAIVVSLGDSRSYFLSTAPVEHGVVYAKSENGNVMRPVSWNEMEDPATGRREKRKVAKLDTTPAK